MLVHILFESIPLLVICWVVVQLGLIGLWSWRRSPGTKYAVWAGFAALPLLLVISKVVETRAENAIAFCRSLADAAEVADVDFIAARLAPDIEIGGYDHDGIVARIRQRLSRIAVQDATLRGFDVTFPDDHCVIEFTATAMVRDPDLTYQWLNSRWRLTLRPAGDSWQITAIDSLPVGPLNLDVLDWLR
ncbi:MAG: hypothetical protein J5J06_15380 [Phycisphaerae bacterium]|nr:hypothetical protein [Phycisphaerae bacterium]